MSLGMGLAFPALSSTALTKVRPEDSGVASSLLNASQQVGASLGAALLNTIAATATASYIASHGSTLTAEGIVHGFTSAFAVGAAILAVGAIVSALLIQGPLKALPKSVAASAAELQ